EEQQHPGPPVAGAEPKRGELVERGVGREYDGLPAEVDEHVAEAHREARARVGGVVADLVVVVVAREVEREPFDDEQQDEGGDGGDDQVDHELSPGSCLTGWTSCKTCCTS